MSATQEIRQLIENRLRAIDKEIVSLNAALKRLDAERASAAAGRNGRTPQNSAASERTRPRRGRSRRSPSEVTPAAVEQIVGQSNGISAGELADQLNADRARVLAQLKELEARGSVRRTGARRGTRWHVITDEDRIRERAAELERRSRRAAGDAGS